MVGNRKRRMSYLDNEQPSESLQPCSTIHEAHAVSNGPTESASKITKCYCQGNADGSFVMSIPYRDQIHDSFPKINVVASMHPRTKTHPGRSQLRRHRLKTLAPLQWQNSALLQICIKGFSLVLLFLFPQVFACSAIAHGGSK